MYMFQRREESFAFNGTGAEFADLFIQAHDKNKGAKLIIGIDAKDTKASTPATYAAQYEKSVRNEQHPLPFLLSVHPQAKKWHQPGANGEYTKRFLENMQTVLNQKAKGVDIEVWKEKHFILQGWQIVGKGLFNWVVSDKEALRVLSDPYTPRRLPDEIRLDTEKPEKPSQFDAENSNPSTGSFFEEEKNKGEEEADDDDDDDDENEEKTKEGSDEMDSHSDEPSDLLVPVYSGSGAMDFNNSNSDQDDDGLVPKGVNKRSLSSPKEKKERVAKRQK